MTPGLLSQDTNYLGINSQKKLSVTNFCNTFEVVDYFYHSYKTGTAWAV